LFLAINAKGGESNRPKAKDRTTTHLKKSKTKGRNYFNWYLFHKREEIISKPHLTAKGKTSLGGAFI
jgi:hypothetical protein